MWNYYNVKSPYIIGLQLKLNSALTHQLRSPYQMARGSYRWVRWTLDHSVQVIAMYMNFHSMRIGTVEKERSIVDSEGHLVFQQEWSVKAWSCVLATNNQYESLCSPSMRQWLEVDGYTLCLARRGDTGPSCTPLKPLLQGAWKMAGLGTCNEVAAIEGEHAHIFATWTDRWLELPLSRACLHSWRSLAVVSQVSTGIPVGTDL